MIVVDIRCTKLRKNARASLLMQRWHVYPIKRVKRVLFRAFFYFSSVFPDLLVTEGPHHEV